MPLAPTPREKENQMATCASDSCSASVPLHSVIPRRASVETLSGYTCSFVREPDSSFSCPICARVLRQPQLTDCCGNHFCTSCLSRWLETSSSCPLCRQVGFRSIKDKKAERALHDLEVYCHLEGSGCPWTGKLCNVDSHLATDCPRVLLECSNSCGDVIHRQDLPDHIQHSCYLRLVHCEHCGIEGPFKQISDEHYSTCPKIPLPCPNQCSTAKILREDIPSHLEECPLEMVVCGFQSLGCRDNIPRKDLESHMCGYQTRHLLLAMERISDLSQLLDTYHGGMEQLKEELEKSQREQESLRLLVQAQQPGGLSSLALTQTGQIQTRQLLMEKHLEASVERCQLDPFLPVVIKMEDYSFHSDCRGPWYSQPFYSAPLCYKLCLCVYANGACSGKFTHLSVYVHLMAGEFDDNLCWPLEMKLTVELQNQLADANHWVVDCDFTRNTSHRIRRRVNQGRAKKGTGSAKFIPLDKLKHNAAFHNCQYLRNNKLFFSVY